MRANIIKGFSPQVVITLERIEGSRQVEGLEKHFSSLENSLRKASYIVLRDGNKIYIRGGK